MRRRAKRQPRENTIALINIVFLMLIFFLVAGTLARPLDGDVRLVRTADLEGAPPPDALVIHADGRMAWRGTDVTSVQSFVAEQPQGSRARLRILPDRDLPASDLIALGRDLRLAGAEKVVIVTERGVE